MELGPVLSGIPKARQIVTKPTHNLKILDVIITNVPAMYCTPEIVPPVPPDDPHCGVPSDHSPAVVYPLCNSEFIQPREFIEKVARPLPDSGIRAFGEWICKEDWAGINDKDDPSKQVETLSEILKNRLDTFFPQKKIKYSPNFDVPFITAELKTLDRKVKRIYRKEDKSNKYCSLKSQFNEKYKKASQNYLDKKIRALKEEQPVVAYKCLKKLGAQPGDCLDENSFTLLNHLEQGLTTEESN